MGAGGSDPHWNVLMSYPEEPEGKVLPTNEPLPGASAMPTMGRNRFGGAEP